MNSQGEDEPQPIDDRSQQITGASVRPTRVLILAETPAIRQLAADCLLQAPGFHVYEPSQGRAEPWPVDVVVVDRSSSLLPGQWVAEGLLRPETQIVAIGLPASGHVNLPAECSGRELVLACELAGRISRLHRHAARQQQNVLRLRRWALADPLTSLANRRAWDAQLQRRCRAARAANRPLALLLLDIDRFKAINDRYGHAEGDDVLRRLAGVLVEQTSPTGYTARLGGDEFGLLLGDLDAGQAWERSERLRRELGQRAGGPVEFFSVSGGLAVCSTPVPPVAAIYRGASDALREAKLAGRNRTNLIRVG